MIFIYLLTHNAKQIFIQLHDILHPCRGRDLNTDPWCGNPVRCYHYPLALINKNTNFKTKYQNKRFFFKFFSRLCVCAFNWKDFNRFRFCGISHNLNLSNVFTIMNPPNGLLSMVFFFYHVDPQLSRSVVIFFCWRNFQTPQKKSHGLWKRPSNKKAGRLSPHSFQNSFPRIPFYRPMNYLPGWKGAKACNHTAWKRHSKVANIRRK